MSEERQVTLAIDFDGTIYRYTRGWKGVEDFSEEPMPGAIEFLEEWSKKGAILIIHSARLSGVDFKGIFPSSSVTQLQQRTSLMLDWFLAHGLSEETARSLHFWTFPGKPHATIYIDDRAWRFEGKWPTEGEITSSPWKPQVDL